MAKHTISYNTKKKGLPLNLTANETAVAMSKNVDVMIQHTANTQK
jgi:hypothetical protein